MASADTTNGNGTAKWWGVTAETWVKWFQTVGVSTALVAFMCVLAWMYVPPIVDGHLQMLQDTSATLRDMNANLTEQTKVLQELSEEQRATRATMEAMRVEIKRGGV